MTGKMIFFKRLLFALLAFVGFGTSMKAELADLHLSDSTVVSLLIAQPSDENVWTVFGHAGIRIKDDEKGLDVTFNYGVFSFTDDFIYKFIKGETDYMLCPYATSIYMDEYLSVGRDVTELILDLRHSEIVALWQYLLWNSQPENAVYRYNFLYDNCSTRPMDILLRVTNGKFILPKVNQNKSWRTIIRYAERNKPWLILGTDLALGRENDNIPSIEETFFLPDYVVKYLPKTRILRPDGSMLAVVRNVGVYSSVKDVAPSNLNISQMVTPLVVSIFVLIVSAFMLKGAIVGKSSASWSRWVVSIVYLGIGLAGSILLFLSTMSVHPHTGENYNLIIVNPLYIIIGIPLLWIKKLRFAQNIFNMFVVLSVFIFLFIGYFIGQTFNESIYLISVALLLQSISMILYNRHSIKSKRR